MTPDELREKLLAWLDRRPPPGSWRDFEEMPDERPWEEFELQRVDLVPDVQMEAGHA